MITLYVFGSQLLLVLLHKHSEHHRVFVGFRVWSFEVVWFSYYRGTLKDPEYVLDKDLIICEIVITEKGSS